MNNLQSLTPIILFICLENYYSSFKLIQKALKRLYTASHPARLVLV